MSSSEYEDDDQYSEYTDDDVENNDKIENRGWLGGDDEKESGEEEEDSEYEEEEDGAGETAAEIKEEEIPLLSEMKTIFQGQGNTFPEKGSLCRIHYVTKLVDGTIVESSRTRGRPLVCKVGVGHLIRGWDECLLRMVEGQHCTLICPPEAAYGERGLPGKIPKNATVVFDVELITILKPPPPTSFNLRVDEEVSSESEEYYSDSDGNYDEDYYGEDDGEDEG